MAKNFMQHVTFNKVVYLTVISALTVYAARWGFAYAISLFLLLLALGWAFRFSEE